MNEQKSTIAVSPFGVTARDQHIIDDDQWYLRFLSRHSKQLIYIAGHYSAQKLREDKNEAGCTITQLPSRKGRIRYELAIVQKLVKHLVAAPSPTIIFFGYSETLLLLCAILLKLKKATVLLVNTNNITKIRVRKYYWPMLVLHKLISKQLARFIVHTEHERQLVTAQFPFLKEKILIKKHHMMVPDRLLQKKKRPTEYDKEVVISCFGPVTRDKSLDVASALIESFAISERLKRRIQVRFYKIPQDLLPDMQNLSENIEISFNDNFLPREHYREKVAESDLVIMNHTPRFEGKLSGILCDCISLNVPFIAQEIEPLRAYNKECGEIGLLLPSSKREKWSEYINSATNIEQLCIMRRNIRAFSKNFEQSKIEKDYLDIFNLSTPQCGST